MTFTIDPSGSRVIDNDRPATIAAFGDSAFCRQVGDGETWESALGREMRTGVLNYGVGNYGLDQALLRYEKTQLPDTVDTVVMAVVPKRFAASSPTGSTISSSATSWRSSHASFWRTGASRQSGI